MRKFLVAAGAAALLSGPSYAVTFSHTTLGPEPGPGPGSNVPAGLYTIDFNSGPVAGLNGSYQLVTGSVPGEYAQPYGGNTRYLSVPLTGPTLPGAGEAWINLLGYDFGGTVNAFSLYWGSIDLYNTLRITTSAQVLDFAFTGANGFPAMPAPPANGAQTTAENNRRIYFDLASGETLQELRFISNGIAFEVDDIVFFGTAVPEPATWAMMIGGFGLVGGSMRACRKRRLATA